LPAAREQALEAMGNARAEQGLIALFTRELAAAVAPISKQAVTNSPFATSHLSI